MQKWRRHSLRALGALLLLALAIAAVPAARGDIMVPFPLPVDLAHLIPPIGGSPPGAGTACKGGAAMPGVDPRGTDPGSPNPLAGQHFFVDPEEQAWYQWKDYTRRGMKGKAALVAKIARQPRFRWFGRFTRPDMPLKISKYLQRVRCTEPGSVPLMTVLRHQGKQCSKSYEAGGTAEDSRTRQWYDEFASAIGSARVVIAFEPDSLGTLDCLARSRRKARLDTLRHGVDVLSTLPNATIYLEGGASDWEPASRTASQLRYIGIAKVRGFMLNVTHYDWTANNIRHGLRISRLTGGKPFIVSTAFNGRGPVHFRKWISRQRNIWRTINVWCHPLMRGLGPAPTTSTSNPRVDAYMWIGRPGYSGGSCNGGPLPVGTWWPKRALMFGKYATSWERPPRGTRYGQFKRYSLRQLGG